MILYINHDVNRDTTKVTLKLFPYNVPSSFSVCGLFSSFTIISQGICGDILSTPGLFEMDPSAFRRVRECEPSSWTLEDAACCNIAL